MGYHNACFILKRVFALLQLCGVVCRRQLGQVGWWFKPVQVFFYLPVYPSLVVSEGKTGQPLGVTSDVEENLLCFPPGLLLTSGECRISSQTKHLKCSMKC